MSLEPMKIAWLNKWLQRWALIAFVTMLPLDLTMAILIDLFDLRQPKYVALFLAVLVLYPTVPFIVCRIVTGHLDFGCTSRPGGSFAFGRWWLPAKHANRECKKQ